MAHEARIIQRDPKVAMPEVIADLQDELADRDFMVTEVDQPSPDREGIMKDPSGLVVIVVVQVSAKEALAEAEAAVSAWKDRVEDGPGREGTVKSR